MTNANYTTQAKTASGSNLVLGAWLVASAWIFIYGTAGAAWNSVAVGIAVTLPALWSAKATVLRNRQESRLAVGP